MKKILAATCAALLSVLATASGAASQAGPASLRGQVYVERQGMLLSGAEVAVMAGGKIIQSTRTDRSGVYRLAGVPPGSYKISVELKGFRRREVEVDLKAGEGRLLDVGLEVGLVTDIPPPPVLSGMVSGQDGQALSDAAVTVVSPLDQKVIGRAISDEGGRYRVSVEGNQFTVIASKPGFVASAKVIFLTEPLSYRKGRAVDFTLEDIR